MPKEKKSDLMGQKCEGNCGLWVLNEKIKKKYPEKNRGSRLGVTC